MRDGKDRETGINQWKYTIKLIYTLSLLGSIEQWAYQAFPKFTKFVYIPSLFKVYHVWYAQQWAYQTGTNQIDG